jgi:hypothetical protein
MSTPKFPVVSQSKGVPAHQHKRYSPPALVTAAVPHVTIVPAPVTPDHVTDVFTDAFEYTEVT